MPSFLAEGEEKSCYNLRGTDNAGDTFLQDWKGAARSARERLLPWKGKMPRGRAVSLQTREPVKPTAAAGCYGRLLQNTDTSGSVPPGMARGCFCFHS